MSRTVEQVMHAGVVTCPAEIHLADVTRMLIENNVHALFVTDDKETVLGVITDIDVLAGEWLFTDDESLKVLQSVTAGDLMTSPVGTINVKDSLGPVAARMARERIHRLLVVDQGKPVGVISVSDVVRELGGSQQVVTRTVQEVMSRAIVSCRADTPLPSIARGMTERHSRSVVVVDAHGMTKGIVTGFDLMQFAEDGGMVSKTATDIMHAPITIHPDATLREAADAMLTHHVHRLVVVDPSDPVAMPLGLISTTDIVLEMAQPDSTWQH